MQRLPSWDDHRTSAGAPATWVDPVDLDDVALRTVGNQPAVPTFDASGWESLLVHWSATGIVDRLTELVTLEPLVWDGANLRWLTEPRFDLHLREVGEFPTQNAAIMAIRVHAQLVDVGASALILRVTGGLEARR